MSSGMSAVSAWMESNGHGSLLPLKCKASDADTFWAPNFPDSTTPNLAGKRRLVLIGSQGTGKTSLFKRLTGDQNAQTSDGLATCTRINNVKPCVAPFQNVEALDPPGLGLDDVHYDDSFQVREGLIRKPVHLIAVVCGLPAVNRLQEVITVLKPMDRIMRCSTFTLDANGVVAPPKGERSHTRTRVLLVLTHRDRFKLPVEQWATYVRGVREKYDWIGSVVMIDPHVPLNNLLACIVLPATCMSGRDYNIPMTEFCSRFPISRALDEEEEMKIMDKLVEFNSGMALAVQKLNEIKTERESLGYSGSSSFVDKIGPTLDCVLRFLDDLYERKSLEALAQLEGVELDDLWADTDEDVGFRRVEKWNAIKSKMGEGYERNKVLVSKAFPTRPLDAIYKKCNHCNIVYVKPSGCDFGTTCGNSIGGQDALPFTYEYVESQSFHIVKNQKMGRFEDAAYKLRRAYASMVANRPSKYYAGADAGAVVQEHKFDKPCGNPIKWETMTPLTVEELQRYNLIPDGVTYEVTLSDTAGAGVEKKDMSMATKLKQISQQLCLDTSMPLARQVSEAYIQLGLDEERATSLAKKVDELYSIVIGG